MFYPGWTICSRVWQHFLRSEFEFYTDSYHRNCHSLVSCGKISTDELVTKVSPHTGLWPCTYPSKSWVISFQEVEYNLGIPLSFELVFTGIIAHTFVLPQHEWLMHGEISTSSRLSLTMLNNKNRKSFQNINRRATSWIHLNWEMY
jgi:hypothetical protein